LLYFLCWGFFGFFLGVGWVFYLSKAWQEVLGTIPDKIPPGIMIAGSLGGFIPVFLCAFVGIAIGSYRARQWGGKPALIAGVLGPVLGCLGCIVAAFLGGPRDWFVGALIGMVLGVTLGRELGVRENNTNKIGPD
jgi:uncharacterized membrane protein